MPASQKIIIQRTSGMVKRTRTGEKQSEIGKRLTTKRPAKAAAKAAAIPVRARKMQQGAPRRLLSPLEQAQKLIDNAMGAADPERQFELAQKALELSAECADAYTLLSRFVADRRHALLLIEQGLTAAERLLGPEKMASLIGKFWGAPETRPYMRARLALAECQWIVGQRQESLLHLTEMLTLNPADDQGVHYALAAHLLELNKDAEFDLLLNKYDESTTFILFSKLLREFRRNGDSPVTRKLLAQSERHNPYVVRLLLGYDPMPDDPPESYLPGTHREGVMYVGDLGHAWKETPGAITWLRRVVDQASAGNSSAAIGPTAAVKNELARIPQRYETIWQARFGRLPMWLREDDRMIRPWSILIVDQTAHKIVGQQVATCEPDAATLFDCLANTMRKPHYGKPLRPSEIQVRENPNWDALQSHLQEIGVDCIYHPDLDEADYVFADMQRAMRPEQPPAIVEVDNFHVSQGASFYQAAADFFLRRPWQLVPSDAVIQIDCPSLVAFGSSFWYAIVLGQGGRTYGLALYSQLCDIQAMGGGCCSAGEVELRGTTISMQYGEAWEVPIDDMLSAERHRWKLAGPEAYPFVLCTEIAMETRHIQPSELQLLEACLRAIPDFLERHPYHAALVANKAVPMSAAKHKIKLSWVEPELGGCGSDCGECC
jgi:hypothetical protein